MSSKQDGRCHERWAHLRFSIIGPLLSAPPERGSLVAEIRRLAEKVWRHPITSKPIRFGISTIQRWYYAARAEKTDPVGVLRRKPRRDSGTERAMTPKLRQALEAQYRMHKRWSYQLHFDNLAALAEKHPDWGPVPSYATVRRYMKRHGLFRKRLGPRQPSPGQLRAEERLESREVRSYEAEYVHALWHLDFHYGSIKILTPEGEWVRPILLAILDDFSRLVCHLQWYLTEKAEDLVHGLCQAFLKRDLPRGLLSDNGSAMIAAETEQGLLRLGIVHDTTLPYSPYQNGKQECFFGQIEGRLLPMLEHHPNPMLPFLNEATQAWVEMEYNRSVHRETGQSPLQRSLTGPSVARACPDLETLRLAFCDEVGRTQRRSDGTISIKGRRFEIPSRYRNLERVSVRYASWDLTRVHLVDARADTVLCRLYPLDKARNADGRRRRLDDVSTPDPPETLPPSSQDAVAPLLRKLMEEYAATGLPPAYLPKTTKTEES